MKREISKFDASELIEEVISSGIDPSIFDEIDDRDIKRAPNFYEWCVGKSFLNAVPYPKQALAGIQLFNDFCPYCTDMDFFLNMFEESISEILDRVQLLEFGKCPKCGKTRIDFYNDKIIYPKRELVVVAGQRAGKTALSGMVATYQLHLYLMLANPARYFSLLPGSLLDMTFCALTAKQAESTLWKAFTGLRNNSTWFKEYHSFLNYHEKKMSIRLLHNMDTYFTYVNKYIKGGFTGADYRTLRGLTRLFSSIDELGYFDFNANSMKVKINADEAYTSLTNSMQTVRNASRKLLEKGIYNAPTAIMCNISSPCSANDKIMQLLRESNFDTYKVAHHYATWEFNPFYSFDDMEKDRKKNPATFDRDFGAVPPFSDSPFLPMDIVESNFDNTYIANNSDQVSIIYNKDVNELGDLTYSVSTTIKMTDKITPRVMSVDTGFNDNSFSISVLHFDNKKNKAVIDLLLEVQPDKDANIKVNFPKIFNESILKIIAAWNIKFVYYDKWQHITQLQTLRDMKVNAVQRSLKYKDFEIFRNHFIIHEIAIPKPEKSVNLIKDSTIDVKQVVKGYPILNLIWQLYTVREVGKKVCKPDKGTDDNFRTLVLAALCLLDEENRKIFRTGTTVINKASGGVLGVVKTYGGGGGNNKGSAASSSSVGCFKPKSSR